MSVGILIITHDEVGRVLLNTATSMLDVHPVSIELLAIPLQCDPDQMMAIARERSARIDQGDGVLVLTDLFGSTPSNIATRLQDNRNVTVVAGLNLPMLLRILNYPKLNLAEIAEKAVSGGRDGVLACRNELG